MARRRKDEPKAGAAGIPLRQPDRSAAPSDETLLKMAHERGLFQQAARDPRNKNKNKSGQPGGDGDAEPVLSPRAERIMETLLWSVSLAMLHFTLDVLVQNQYAVALQWHQVILRALQALLVFAFLFYFLHAHASSPLFVPGLPRRWQEPARQVVFFAVSVLAGCHLIYITNRHGYLAVMKRAPTLGCLWVWAVIELSLGPAVLSLLCAVGYLWQGGYSIK